MLEIRILESARKFILNLESKSARQVVRKINQLAENPLPPQSKILEGYAPLRRLRCGDYRIVYFVDNKKTLKVPLVEKRGDDKVYRRLKRLFG